MDFRSSTPTFVPYSPHTGRVPDHYGFLGIAVGPKAQYNKWKKNEANRHANYNKCVERRKLNGKKAYPDPEAGGGANCSTIFTNWSKAVTTKAQKAKAYKSHLQKKKELTAGLRAELDAAMKAPAELLAFKQSFETTSHSADPAAASASAYASDASADWSYEEGADWSYEEGDDTSPPGFPLWLVGVGGVVFLGGIVAIVATKPQ